jgi:outer membrane protein assembly factor BamB
LASIFAEEPGTDMHERRGAGAGCIRARLRAPGGMGRLVAGYCRNAMRARKLVAAALIALATAAPEALAADESTAWMANPRHDNQLSGSPLQPPLAVRWDVPLGKTISNVLVADGRVILVRADASGAPQLTALEAATGRVLWSIATAAGRIAYDGGRVFATQGTGVAGFSADNGARLWTTDLQADYGVPELVADGGTVFAFMNEPGSKVAALRGSDGGIVWTSPTLHSGTSSPAVDATRVYVGLGGGQTFALNRTTGAIAWHYTTCCSGGGGTSVVLNGDRVYAEAEGFKVLSAASGQMVGTYIGHNGTDYSQPAFAGSLGIFRPATGLIAAGPDGATAWTFAGEALRPLTANGHAYSVVFGSGIDDRAILVALNLASGAPQWCVDLGVRDYPDGVVGPISGGQGLLVVPVDDRLVAFGNGGGAAPCPPPPPPGAPGTPAPAGGGSGSAGAGGTGSSVEVDSGSGPGPRLTLRANRTDLVVGERTRLSGVVSGMPKVAGVRVRIQADDHPFGRWRTLVRPRTRADGTYAVLLKAAKNVRLRAYIERVPRVRTSALTVYADLPARLRRLGAGGANPRLQVQVAAPGSAGIRGRRVVFYLAQPADQSYRRIARVAWRRGRGLVLTATATYPKGTLGSADRVLVCTGERKPDAFGRPTAYDRVCGAATLPRS